MKAETLVPVGDRDRLVCLFGAYDEFLRLLRDALDVQISVRGTDVRLKGDADRVRRAEKTIQTLLARLNTAGQICRQDVEEALGAIRASARRSPPDAGPARFAVEPKTPGQSAYLHAIREHDIVFSIGPAGTGKTFLAVSAAVSALSAGTVRRIILCRPAVEAGERLGFLPGDYQAKINPYLRPLYDALNSMLEFGQLKRLMENEIVEIAPLAYMRGRTLDDAFILLDEAQNTTHDQMKMFLTRMGQRSRIVVTGDITQIDLPPGKISGLVEVQRLLKHVRGIAFSYLTRADIVRHPLVQQIVDAYERHAGTPPRARRGR